MFSPERPCGTHQRGPNAYTREEVETIARQLDIPLTRRYQTRQHKHPKAKTMDQLCKDLQTAQAKYQEKELPPPVEFREYKTDVKVPKYLLTNRTFQMKKGLSKYIQPNIRFTQEPLPSSPNQPWKLWMLTPHPDPSTTTYFHRENSDALRTNANLYNLCQGKLHYNYLYSEIFQNFVPHHPNLQNMRILVATPSTAKTFLQAPSILPFDSSQLLGYAIFEMREKSLYVETICTRTTYLSRLEYVATTPTQTQDIKRGLGRVLLDQIETYSKTLYPSITYTELDAAFTAVHPYIKLRFVPFGPAIRSYLSRPPTDHSEKIQESLTFLRSVRFRQKVGRPVSHNVVVALYWILQDIMEHHYRRFEKLKTIPMYRPIGLRS